MWKVNNVEVRNDVVSERSMKVRIPYLKGYNKWKVYNDEG